PNNPDRTQVCNVLCEVLILICHLGGLIMAYRSIGKALARSGGRGGGKPVRKQFLLFVLATLFLATVNPTHAQQAGKVFRIGFLDNSTASGSAVLVEAFRQELNKLGWIEGKNITIEYRFAEQKLERVPELAA